MNNKRIYLKFIEAMLITKGEIGGKDFESSLGVSKGTVTRIIKQYAELSPDNIQHVRGRAGARYKKGEAFVPMFPNMDAEAFLFCINNVFNDDD